MNANAAVSAIPNITKHIANTTPLNTKVSSFNLVLKPQSTDHLADGQPTQESDINSPPTPLHTITVGNVLAFSKVTAAFSAIVSARGSYAFRAGETGRGPSAAGKASDIQQVLPTTSVLQSTTPTVATNASKPPSAQLTSSSPPPPTPRQLTTIPIHPTKATPAIISNSKRPTIIIYPTVSPESIVIPIVSCILGFPLLALMVICCLRRRAKLARERDRRRNYDMQDHAVSLVRFSPIHRLNNRSSRAVSLRPERSLSRGFPSLELDTVIEERSDPEQTQTDIISPESPLDPHKFRDFNSS